MKINSINYEAFALEYIEGKLSEEKRQEMELFLSKHPAIAQELEELKEFPVLEKKAIVYPNKRELLKREKKTPFVLPIYRRIVASAAVILLVGSVYLRLFYKADVVQDPIYTQEEYITPATPATIPSGEEVEIAIDEKELPPTNSLSPLAKTRQSLKERESSPKRNFQDEDKLARLDKKVAQLPVGANDSQSTGKNQGVSVPQTTVKETAITQNQSTGQSLVRQENNPSQIKESTVKRITKEVSHIAALPTIQQRNISYKQQPINLPTKELFEQSIPGALASSPSNKRTLKSFLGKLPVKVDKNAFIPSFFTEEVGGQ